jgi:hypothetical protein
VGGEGGAMEFRSAVESRLCYLNRASDAPVDAVLSTRWGGAVGRGKVWGFGPSRGPTSF